MSDPRPIKASRRSEIDPFRAMDVMAEANRMVAAGVDVISLAVGQPSAPVPPSVAEAAAEERDSVDQAAATTNP